jgi:hypothetical protein
MIACCIGGRIKINKIAKYATLPDGRFPKEMEVSVCIIFLRRGNNLQKFCVIFL